MVGGARMTATAKAAPVVSLPVQAATVRASIVAVGDRRLEAESYLTEGYQLRRRIERAGGFDLQTIANVWQPGRLKGIQVPRENGIPFLAATQVFDIRPTPRKWLALQRTPDIEQRYVKNNWILVTCSGSIGNVIRGYRATDRIIISHDLLRVVPNSSEDYGYLYSFLRSRHARAMMRSSKYRNVIKHLEPEHLQAIPVVPVGEGIKRTLNSAVTRCFELRDEAYQLGIAAENDFASAIGPLDTTDAEIGYSVTTLDLYRKARRLDAYSHNPVAAAIIENIRKTNNPVVPLSKVSKRVFMPPRFVRKPADSGVPFLGSEDLFRVNPEIDKFLEKSAANDELLVQRGWLLVARSGQIYGINGRVILAMEWHEGKIISEDAIRVIPDGIRAGYLLVALDHPVFGRPLVLREVYGTSIPHIDPDALEDTPIVRLGDIEDLIANKAERSAALRSIADDMENAAVGLVESVVAHALGDASEDDIDTALAHLRLIEIKSDPKSLVQGKALEARLARIPP
jgi:type I restriction enzyme S subunit